MGTKYIKSPLNYTGGKYKLLGSIIPLLPENIDTFIDLFAGGLNVGINVNADRIIANDQITYLIELYSYFRDTDVDMLLEKIDARINEYQLSDTNVEGYLELRKAYNNKKNPLDLFILTCYSFNHQIRFNSKHEFNTPFGKERSSFNESIKNNLINFCNALQEKHILLSSYDFRDLYYEGFGKNDIVYCDPPYLITTGTYNDGKRGFNGWTDKDDRDLFNMLDYLAKKDVKFLLSNVFYHKGQANGALIEWSKKYNVLYLDKKYSNCSYHFKDRDTKTVEVLVTNMSVKEINDNAETAVQLTL